MRASLLLVLLYVLAPTLAHGQTLSEALEREAKVLRAEKQALEASLEDARASGAVARDALSASIESASEELVRLRAQNARQEARLPERERLRDAESQARELEEIRTRARGWLDLHGGASRGGIEEVLQRVYERGALRRVEDQTVFDLDGAAQSRSVLRIGRVGALSDGYALVPTGEAYRSVLRTTGRMTQDGVVQGVVVYDPEDPDVAFSGRGISAWLEAGGPLLWPILALAALALGVLLERSLRLLAVTIAWRRWRDALGRYEELHEWDAAAKAAHAAEPRWMVQPFIDILSGRELSVRKVEERATESMLKIRPQLQRRLTVLGVTAAVAPLLGLLGTVTGMISTFSAITAHGTGDPKMLSDGISEALITTQLGLSVAVPALLLHTGLLRWSSAIFSQIEDACTGLLHHIEDLELGSRGDEGERHVREHHG